MKRGRILLLILAALLVCSTALIFVHKKAPQEVKVEMKPVEEQRDTNEELYVMRDNGKYGYINKAGLVIIKPEYEDGYNFSEGLARVAIHHKYGFIDKSGKLVSDVIYDDAGDFSQGLALVGIDNKYGFINSSGQLVIPIKYELVSAFSEGLAAVYAAGKWGFMNVKGEIIIKPQFENVGSFKNGLAPVMTKGLYGYIGKNGKYAIKPQFTFAYDFSEGMAEIGMNNKYGYIDTKGNIVVEPKYDANQDFSNGLAAVMQNEKWGFINKKGTMVIAPVYETADGFSEGLAAVFDGTIWGYIDVKGNMAIKPQFTYAEKFYKGMAAVRIDDVFSYIDKQGNLVWHETEEAEIQGLNGTLGRLIKMKIKSDKYDLVIKYPHVVDMQDKALQSGINDILMKQSGTDYKGQPDDTYRQDYDVMLNKNGMVSILNNSFMYMKGAAHGMNMRSAINIDMTTGRLYALKDLFKEGADYKGRLNDIVKKQLAEGNIPLLREFDGVEDKQEYYLTDKELVIYYQLYDYTPYAYGFLEFYIPYQDISSIIDKNGPVGKILE